MHWYIYTWGSQRSVGKGRQLSTQYQLCATTPQLYMYVCMYVQFAGSNVHNTASVKCNY